ncbi:DUF3667 domain-containing protein [Aquimarina sp. AU474]|uniref:DUF3667 domain-containing protein n=1 Tax=Aquimarina sp. AU474 TaxID=2108529 RepID=UPI000D68706C|nr:DUF3667 domain-containing protein [Aquimarina sp. AU474]
MTELNHQCKNCEHQYQGEYCNQCGQKRIIERWTIKKLFNNALTAVLNLEKGYFYTFNRLLVNPGEVVENYLNGNTVKYSNPFRYALIGIAISIFFIFTLGVWDLQVDGMVEMYRNLGIIQNDADELVMRERMGIGTKFMNFLPFFMIPFISLSSKLFLERYKLYYAEHFIMNTLLLGQATLYGVLVSISIYFLPDYISLIFVLGILIAAFVYCKMFHHLFKISYVKGFFLGLLIYLFGYMFFIIFVSIITVIAIILSLIFKAVF